MNSFSCEFCDKSFKRKYHLKRHVENVHGIIEKESFVEYVFDTKQAKMPFSFFKSVKAQDDDELVDPQVTLKEKCSEEDHCSGLKTRLDECNARVLSKKQTTEQCTEELFDFLHCVDHCVSKTLFSHLK